MSHHKKFGSIPKMGVGWGAEEVRWMRLQEVGGTGKEYNVARETGQTEGQL